MSGFGGKLGPILLCVLPALAASACGKVGDIPAPRLEQCIEASAGDANKAGAMDDMFLNARIYVRVDEATVKRARARESNSETYLISYYTMKGEDGAPFIPVYSSKEKMLAGLGNGPFLGIKGREVLDISRNNAIVLNYNAPPSVIWDGQAKEDLRGRQASSPDLSC